jgi:glutathione S-transferase
MILVGQLDSPYVRRVAVSLRLLGHDYESDERSVFGDFESMRTTNPLARIPSLILDSGETLIDSHAILDSGETLIDSHAILDWLDDQAGDGALLPRTGDARRHALQRIALATGAIDKIGGGAVYERVIRPGEFFWQDWYDRCRTQGVGAIEALERLDWDDTVDQPAITTVCMLRFVEIAMPELVPAGRYPALDALRERCESLPEFQATYPPEYVVPEGG